MAVGAFSGGGLGFGLAFQLRDEFSQSAARIQQSMGGLEGSAAALEGNVSAAMSRMAAGFGLLVAGGAILAPVFKGIFAAADMEQTSIAFEVMLKDVDLAKKTLLDLRKFADVTPFEDKPVIAAGRALLAYGMKTKDIIPTLTLLGNVASGVGADITDLTQMYGKNLLQPKLMTRDIYQFMNQGIPIVAALAKVMGVAENSIMDMVEKGKVGIPQMKAAFEAMGSGAGQYAGLMDRQSQSFKGRMSTIASYFGQIFEFAGNALLPVAKRIQDVIGGITEKIKNFIQTPFGQTIVKIATALGIMLVVLGAALIVSGAYQWATIKLATSFMSQAYASFMATVATQGYVAALWMATKAAWSLIAPTVGWIALAYVIYYIGQKMRIWEKIGAIFSGLSEVWSSFDSNTGVFTLSDATTGNLNAMGLLDTVISLGTWIIRLKVLFENMWTGFITGIGYVKAGIDWVLTNMPLMSILIGKNTTDLSSWGTVGEYVGYAVALAFTVWGLRSLWAFTIQAWGWVKSTAIAMFNIVTLKTGLMSLGTAMWASLGLIGLAVIAWQKFGVVGKIVAAIIGIAVVAYWAWTAAQWALNAALYANPIVWIIALVVLAIAVIVGMAVAIWKLVEVIVNNWDVITAWFSGAWDAVAAFFSGLWDWVAGVWDIGVQFVQNLWGGIKSVWQLIIDWIVQKAVEIGDLIAAPFKAVAGWLGIGGDANVSVSQGTAPTGGMTTAGDVKAANRTASQTFMPSGMMQPTQDGLQPIVIHTNLHVDGAKMAGVVREHNRNDQGRGGDYGD
jgi:tape measure domain-containing protein